METFTPVQEKLNAGTHFLGLLIGLIAIPILLFFVISSPVSTVVDLAGTMVYGLGFIMVFAFSALYHHHTEPKLKYRFEIWDHFGIYFMIAGSYTPFILAYAKGSEQIALLIAIWIFAIMGSIFKFFFPDRFRIVSMLIYIAMGLLIVASPQDFKDALPAELVWWLAAGAVFYITGLIFYLWAIFKHHHAVWHCFVLAGACCHYMAVLKIYL